MRNIVVAIWFGAFVLTGCGAPVLRNVPQANSGSVALVSALIATGAMLLTPGRHAWRVEARYGAMVDHERPMKVTEIVPAAVLDRLDAAN